MRLNHPVYYLFANLLSRSAYFMSDTVCFCFYRAIALAYCVRLHLGRLLKSFIKEKGRAVIPTAPQQANIGYPIRHRIAIKKHGKVAVI